MCFPDRTNSRLVDRVRSAEVYMKCKRASGVTLVFARLPPVHCVATFTLMFHPTHGSGQAASQQWAADTMQSRKRELDGEEEEEGLTCLWDWYQISCGRVCPSSLVFESSQASGLLPTYSTCKRTSLPPPLRLWICTSRGSREHEIRKLVTSSNCSLSGLTAPRVRLWECT